jgi:hypothetical protein
MSGIEQWGAFGGDYWANFEAQNTTENIRFRRIIPAAPSIPDALVLADIHFDPTDPLDVLSRHEAVATGGMEYAHEDGNRYVLMDDDERRGEI